MSISNSPDPDPREAASGNKRKRSKDTGVEDEIEIDLSLPEPASKKSKRQAKKKSSTSTTATNQYQQPASLKSLAKPLAKAFFSSDAAQSSSTNRPKSAHGVWIGNLPFTASRDDIRDFLFREGGIEGKDLVRLHLPVLAPTRDDGDKKQKKNKGFAYVDFTTEEVCTKAITLSEKLVSGRRVLIKSSKDFEGRPAPPPQEKKNHGPNVAGERKVFVGNLSFETTKEDLTAHFEQAGELEDAFLATFEDSGKCKGFGWVRFTTAEAAEKAVKGWFSVDAADDDESEAEEELETGEEKKKRKQNKKKVFLHRLHGRALRCEFAQDAQTRYKKRFSSSSINKPSHAGRHESHYSKSASNGNSQRPLSIRLESEENENDDRTLHSLVQQASDARQAPKAMPQRRAKVEAKRSADIDVDQSARTTASARGVIAAGQGKKIYFE